MEIFNGFLASSFGPSGQLWTFDFLVVGELTEIIKSMLMGPDS